MSRPLKVSDVDGRAGRRRVSVSNLRAWKRNRLASTIRSTARWKRVRVARRAIDGERCTYVSEGVRCGETRRLEVHHIDPLSVTLTNAYDLDRLRTLCPAHHRLVEYQARRQAQEGR